MERASIFFQLEEDLNFLRMEDDPQQIYNLQGFGTALGNLVCIYYQLPPPPVPFMLNCKILSSIIPAWNGSSMSMNIGGKFVFNIFIFNSLLLNIC